MSPFFKLRMLMKSKKSPFVGFIYIYEIYVDYCSVSCLIQHPIFFCLWFQSQFILDSDF